MNLLDKGFRPFFLLASAFAAAIVPLWLVVFTGGAAPRGPLSGVVWHSHEMIFGYTAAVLAGFLLTAAANWTGRETLTGAPLGGLAAVWVAGRVALFAVPGWPASAIDLSFLPLLALAIGWPIWQSGNHRNAFLPALLLGMAAANLAIHLDAAGVWPGVAIAAGRLAVHAVAVIILVIAGRIVPMFTRNATGVAGLGNLPALDTLAIGATAAFGVLPLVYAPAALLTSVGAVAAVAVAARTWRWGARASLGTPLLWILHLGHGWVAVGLALEAAGPWIGLPASTGLHALTAGSIGALTLGMMARVALGHTGRPLQPRPAVAVAFALVSGAGLLRVVGPAADPAHLLGWLIASTTLWSMSFVIYVVAHAAILVGPRTPGG